MRALVVAALLLGCDRPGEAPADARTTGLDGDAPEAAPVVPALESWGIRLVRSCPPWVGTLLDVDASHVFGCSDTVFDRETGEVIASVDAPGSFITAAGAGSVWDDHDGHLVFVDAELRQSRLNAWSLWGAAPPFALDGSDGLVFVALDGLQRVDLTTLVSEPVAESARCADARAVSRTTAGDIDCWFWLGDGKGTLVRTLGTGATARHPGAALRPAADAPYRFAADGVLTVPRIGGVVSFAFDGDARLLDVQGDEALVSTDGAVVLVRLDDPDAAPERVAEDSDDARFVGDQIVAEVGGSLAWLARGATWTPPAHDVEAPAELGPVAPDTVREESVSGLYRSLSDVAAFATSDAGLPYVFVSVHDRAQLRRFEGSDEAWGRAAGARFVSPHRAVSVFRDAHGVRTLRGYMEIGGCTHGHYDVRVRELESLLEVTIVATEDRERVSELLGTIPRDRLRLEPVGPERIADPSIGTY